MKTLFRKISFDRLNDGFRKTRDAFSNNIQQVLHRYEEIDDDLYDDLEAVLLGADVGPATAAELIERLRKKARTDRITDPAGLRPALQEIVASVLREAESEDGDSGGGAVAADGPRPGEPDAAAPGPAAAPGEARTGDRDADAQSGRAGSGVSGPEVGPAATGVSATGPGASTTSHGLGTTPTGATVGAAPPVPDAPGGVPQGREESERWTASDRQGEAAEATASGRHGDPRDATVSERHDDPEETSNRRGFMGKLRRAFRFGGGGEEPSDRPTLPPSPPAPPTSPVPAPPQPELPTEPAPSADPPPIPSPTPSAVPPATPPRIPAPIAGASGDRPGASVAAGASASGDPRVMLIVGVNGVGKTTSLAKLARRAQESGEIPLIVASDTFRAAASEQLTIWAERLGVQIVRSQTGADPGAVAFDGIRAARARGATVVLIDTAGRLQTKGNLMEELKKIHRVCGKALPGAPHETLLVLDATIGQNAISQARLFSEAIPIDGILLAKLDGTSKGGVVLSIVHELKVPVRYAGVGEKADDLVDFDPTLFAEQLVGGPPSGG